MGNLKKPEIKVEVITILSMETIETLKGHYDRVKNNWIGGVIRDTASVVDKLTEWISLKEADDLIPYNEGKQCNFPMGARIWCMSRRKGKFYCGQLFDIQIKSGLKKEKIEKCKINPIALKFLKEEVTIEHK